MPVVSVVMPSYNHGKYIQKSIESVLLQSVRDLELIIVDDGSMDDTIDVVNSFDDDRIHFIPLKENVGACAAMNIAISHCKGDLIAVCNSDDLWVHDKLERQMKVFEIRPNIGAVFSDVVWIDDKDNEIEDERRPAFQDVFRQPNRSRYAWIRKLVEEGNCLCHPSVLIRKSVYTELGAYNNFLRQLPDLDMWLRTLQHYEIHVMSEALVNFRIHDNNTSKIDLNTVRRTWQEHRLILREFFEKVTKDNFLCAFGAQSPRAFSSSRARDFLDEKVDYLLNHTGHFSSLFRSQALEIIYTERENLDGSLMRDLDFQQLSTTYNAPHEPSAKDLEILRLGAEVSVTEILKSACEDARREVALIRASTSWKITAPLRRIVSLIRK